MPSINICYVHPPDSFQIEAEGKYKILYQYKPMHTAHMGTRNPIRTWIL